MQTIVNTQPRMIVINHSYTYGVDDDGKTRANGVINFHLAPGVNIIDSGAWDVAKNDSDIKRMIGDGWLEVGVKVESPTAALKKLGPDAAVNIVGKTNDPKLLDAWSDVEKRGSVQTAISTRKKTLADEGKVAK